MAQPRAGGSRGRRYPPCPGLVHLAVGRPSQTLLCSRDLGLGAQGRDDRVDPGATSSTSPTTPASPSQAMGQAGPIRRPTSGTAASNNAKISPTRRRRRGSVPDTRYPHARAAAKFLSPMPRHQQWRDHRHLLPDPRRWILGLCPAGPLATSICASGVAPDIRIPGTATGMTVGVGTTIPRLKAPSSRPQAR